MSVTPTTEGGRGRSKCRVKACSDVRREAKTEIARLNARVTRLETDIRLNGTGNARDAEYRRLGREIEGLHETVRQNAWNRASVEKQLRAAEGERLGLAGERAQLLAEVSLLRGRVAEFERAEQRREQQAVVRERYAARAVAREQWAARQGGERAVRGAEAEVAKAQATAAEARGNAEAAIAAAQAAAAEQVAAAQARLQADADRAVMDAEARAAAAEAKAAAAEEWAMDAEEDADAARAALIEEEQAAREAADGKSVAEYEAWDAERRAKRAKERVEALEAKVGQLAARTKGRLPEEWAAL